MVRDGGFERGKTSFMVVGVRTKVIEGINLGKEEFFHLRQRGNMAGVQLGHRIGMAFLHIPEAFVQLVEFLEAFAQLFEFREASVQFVQLVDFPEAFVELVKQRKKCVNFLILPTKDITNRRGACNHSLVEGVVGIGSPFAWSVGGVGVGEGTKAVPCQWSQIRGWRVGRELEGSNPRPPASKDVRKSRTIRF